ncbi:hypothetical protein [Methylorubrum suomiense]|uniref:Helix-turn-helix domain-containing protein n=1 Tax=Methylorubrum suomiense TaxID=144191 RepID=A0ABQ4V5A5_9HYPH|nr:hypothetical protein [Methylorubrum suomiense]GJE78638.1 hypothetical protein BGCPKDLD_5256 [Methylorubrum suomiense]
MELTPEGRRQRVALKFSILEIASTDDRMTAGTFRFLARILQALDLPTWTSTIGDERIMAEVPGCANRRTCTDHRAKLQKLGYLEFEAGSGRHPTRYFLTETLPAQAEESLLARKDQLEVRRALQRAKNSTETGDGVHRPTPDNGNEGGSTDPGRVGPQTTRSLVSSPSTLPVKEISLGAHTHDEAHPRCFWCGNPADLTRGLEKSGDLEIRQCTSCGSSGDEIQAAVARLKGRPLR